MVPRAKRQRLSEDGADAVTATADVEQTVNGTANGAVDEKAPKQTLSQRRSLFVRSLAPTVSSADLTEHFSESYPIKHAIAVLDKETKECKGYGFVTFADAEDAQRALDELHGSELQGKKIRIEFAESRHRDVDTEVPGRKKSSGPSAASAKAKAVREQQMKDNQSPRIIIRNLPWTIRQPEELAALFRSYGKVKTATLPKTKTGQLKGFGFVLVRGRKNAEKALAGVNGKEVDGRTLAVDWAVDKDTWQNLQSNAPQDSDDVEGDQAIDDSDAESSVVSSDTDGSDDEDDEEDGFSDYEDLSSDNDDHEAEENDVETSSDTSLNTLFVRNLPFSVDDETLEQHFENFGKVRYARVVLDHETERPKGTGFVCFVNTEDANKCLREIPRTKLQKKTTDKKDGSSISVIHSVLEDEDADPSGKYTMEGRVLQISHAVNRNEAARLTAEGAASRFNRDKDKRRLYLLSEGTIASNTPLYQKLSPSEVSMRENSAKQRQKLIQSNPSLHLSYTRLAVRNVPRSVTSKDLKELARRAVVGFAEDVKAGKRQRLSKEEIARGGEEMRIAEKIRKKRGKGIVKQAKIVFETSEGSKIADGNGAGRSRGYGFIEYYTHRTALMGLRWLNGHAVDYRVKGEQSKSKKVAKEAVEDRKKRLIVEFAIENANVVSRRGDRETKSREKSKPQSEDTEKTTDTATRGTQKGRGTKRKRDDDTAQSTISSVAQQSKKKNSAKQGGALAGEKGAGSEGVESGSGAAKREKVAQRSRIIRRKREAKTQARRAKKASKV